ncbi:MAG: choice-of-anchor M domain-containing protein [Verrucomicrobiota bacterium]|nr:choice-of-anchor M domain-containing protein [Verrucomicrobiota bacterium]MCC6822572.1 choice-of-anchor M domain-containing protein [Limisphaerales bacterium]
MKKQNTQIIGHIRQLGLAALLTTGLASQAQTYLWEGHTDVGIVYELGAWNLHIGRHDDIPPMEYAPNEAVLGVDLLAAGTTVPANPQYGFLGTAGSPVWILPEVQNPALLFLGFGTEELANGLFVGDQVTMSLQAVRGPGQFSVYDVDMFGSPNVFMNSGNGITGADSIVLPAGGHQHANWAFSTPGTYEVDFNASGTLVDGNVFTSSGPITYTFEVAAVPEPSALALLLLGGFGLAGFARRRNDRA